MSGPEAVWNGNETRKYSAVLFSFINFETSLSARLCILLSWERRIFYQAWKLYRLIFYNKKQCMFLNYWNHQKRAVILLLFSIGKSMQRPALTKLGLKLQTRQRMRCGVRVCVFAGMYLNNHIVCKNTATRNRSKDFGKMHNHRNNFCANG